MKNITLRLDLEIVGKSSIKLTRSGIRYYSFKTKESMNAIKTLSANYMNLHSLQQLKGALKMEIDMFFRIPKSFSKKKREMALAGILHHTTKPDISNVMKLVEDSMNNIVFQDDSHIIEARQSKQYSDTEYMIVSVTELGGYAAQDRVK